ncbi:hypothetical protein G9A89_007023 [Geosiphon pyriformis]|nr:hypothetical protein G9A89_007023 [Geosiphon pyriformis]
MSQTPTLNKIQMPLPRKEILSSNIGNSFIGSSTNQNKSNNLPNLAGTQYATNFSHNSKQSSFNLNNIQNRNQLHQGTLGSLLSPPESPDMASNHQQQSSSNTFDHYGAQISRQQHEQQQRQQQRYAIDQPQYNTLPAFTSTVKPEPIYSSIMTSGIQANHYSPYPQQLISHPISQHPQQQQQQLQLQQLQQRQQQSTYSSTLQPVPNSAFNNRSLSHINMPSIQMITGNDSGLKRTVSKAINDQSTGNSMIAAASLPSSSSNANRYQCPYCSKRFSRPSSLRIHTYSHTGEKPFVCSEPGCGRKFSVQSNMRRHLRVHRLGRSVEKVRYDGEVEGVKLMNLVIIRSSIIIDLSTKDIERLIWPMVRKRAKMIQ